MTIPQIILLAFMVTMLLRQYIQTALLTGAASRAGGVRLHATYWYQFSVTVASVVAFVTSMTGVSA